MAGFTRLSPRDFKALAKTWGFTEEAKSTRNGHPALLHPAHPGAKLKYNGSHSKGHGTTVAYAAVRQAANILGLPNAGAFLDGPELWRDTQEAKAMARACMKIAEQVGGPDAVIEDIDFRDDGNIALHIYTPNNDSQEPTNMGEPAMPIADISDGKISCPECGAVAAQNGNPFTPQSLATHRSNVHTTWTCPDCETTMSPAGKGKHLAACNKVNPTTKIPCGLCGTKLQKRNLSYHVANNCGTVKGWRNGSSTPGLIEDDFTRSLVEALPDWELLKPGEERTPEEVDAEIEQMAELMTDLPAYVPEHAEPFPPPGLTAEVSPDDVVTFSVNASKEIEGTVDASLDLYLGEFPKAPTMSQQQRLLAVRAEMVAILSEASQA